MQLSLIRVGCSDSARLIGLIGTRGLSVRVLEEGGGFSNVNGGRGKEVGNLKKGVSGLHF